LAKNVGDATTSGGLMGAATSVLSAASGSEGIKFSRMDVKRVYFVGCADIWKIMYIADLIFTNYAAGKLVAGLFTGETD